MGNVNWARVIIGGLLAGVVMFVLGFFLYGLWLSKEFNEALQALGRPPMSESAGMIGFILVINLITGMVALWLYAAIRPRLGPGPKTAVCAGLVVWTLGGLLPNIWWSTLDLMPSAYLVKDTGAGLVLWVVGTVIGASVYKE